MIRSTGNELSYTSIKYGELHVASKALVYLYP